MRFLLVDRILELDPGNTVHAQFSMPPTEDLFKDHFPGFPVVPGVLLIEMMGQAAGKCLRASNADRGVAVLGRVASATFRDWVGPGQIIDLFAEITLDKPAVAKAKCRAEVGGTLKATAELMFGFVSQSEFSADYRDEVLELFLKKQAY